MRGPSKITKCIIFCVMSSAILFTLRLTNKTQHRIIQNDIFFRRLGKDPIRDNSYSKTIRAKSLYDQTEKFDFFLSKSSESTPQ